ncbi:putative PCNA [Feldmannia species virus]|uniref:Putative PCNA n=1 Tax=Feldmannia species virus TaxID=39420 RepID=B5LWG9_9PHYC|nr:putative PCNA [Feldmannia species virus]ACH46832.1 putative PCNA [Feldmannia species virus]
MSSKIPVDVGHAETMEDTLSVKNPVQQPMHEDRKLIFLMRTSQCAQFKSLCECLKELLTDVNMEFIENKGIRLVSIDPGRVAMVHLVVNSVEYFYVKGTVTAGMNMAFLYRMIRSLSSGDYMEWRIYEDNPHAMNIELYNSDRRTRTVSSMKLLDLDEVEISIPNVEYDRVVSMPSSELSKHVREMVAVSNFVTVRGTRSTLEFIAEGEMASSHITIHPTASGLNWKFSEDVGDIEGKFVVRYLEKFGRVGVEANVELFLKTDFPLILRYELSIGTLRFVIAPVKD